MFAAGVKLTLLADCATNVELTSITVQVEPLLSTRSGGASATVGAGAVPVPLIDTTT